jgi:hypothetical protein
VSVSVLAGWFAALLSSRSGWLGCLVVESGGYRFLAYSLRLSGLCAFDRLSRSLSLSPFCIVAIISGFFCTPDFETRRGTKRQGAATGTEREGIVDLGGIK